VTAALAAYKGPWSTFTGTQRSACLLKVADLIEAALPKVAEVETLSMGTPIAIQLNTVGPAMVTMFRYYAGLATVGMAGDSFPIEGDAYRVGFLVFICKYGSDRF